MASRKKPRPASRGPAPAQGQRGSGARLFLARRAVWVGTILTAVVTAVVTGTVTDLTKQLVSPSAGNPSPPAGSSAGRPGEPPVRATMLVEREASIQGDTYVLPEPLDPNAAEEALLANPFGLPDGNADRFHSWVVTRHGADPDLTFAKVVLEGRRASTVRVLDMKVDVLARGRPLTGTLMVAGGGGGGAVTKLGFNLDEKEPVARTIVEPSDLNVPFGDPYFRSKTISLTAGEQEVFAITATTKHHSVEWCVGLTLLVDGKVENSRVCPPGGAARTTAYVLNPKEPRPGYNIDVRAYQRLYVMPYDATNAFVKRDPKTFMW